MKEFIHRLEWAWESGFFYSLRQGHFNKNQYLEIKILFDSFTGPEEMDGTIDRRFVSLVWFIPTFISWQRERLAANGVCEETIDEIGEYFYSECEKILGLP